IFLFDKNGDSKIMVAADSARNKQFNVINGEFYCTYVLKNDENSVANYPDNIVEDSFQELSPLAITGEYKGWKQYDSRWASKPVANGGTMKQIGCTVTSTAIGVVHGGMRDESNFDPGKLCDYLNNNGGFTSDGGIYWDAVTRMVDGFWRNNIVSLSGSNTQKAEVIADYVDSGYIVLISVNNDGHWVCCDYVDGNTVYMMDPGRSGATNLFSTYSGISRIVTYGIDISKSNIDGSQTETTNHNPIGSFDGCSGGTGYIEVSGWAFDPDNTSQQLYVHVYIGGPAGVGEGYVLVANTSRPDVNNAYGCGDNHGFFDKISTDKTGSQEVYAYAINVGSGDNTLLGSETVNIKQDTTPPVISNVNVIKSATGYTVSCTVKDSGSGVNRVQFPTWTTANDQDDVIGDWVTNSKASGTKDGDTYTYSVKYSDHNDEQGFYNTHIYAYDNVGNSDGVPANGGNYYKYPIKYNANGGSGAPANQTKVYKVELTLSGTKPTRDGYAFKNWNTKADGTGISYSPSGKYTTDDGVTLYDKNGAITLYAIWETNKYTVTYNANGGSGQPGNQTKVHGTDLTLSGTKPTRDGYTFKNWNTKSDGTGTSYSAGGKYTANANVTLYAIWEINKYTISYNANGGSGQPGNQIKTYGTDLTLSGTQPTRPGYTFKNWNTKSDGTGTSYSAGGTYKENNSVTLYAVWKLDTTITEITTTSESSTETTTETVTENVNSVNLEIADVNAISGKYVDIPVVLKNNAGISCFNISLGYDNSIMYPVSYTKGDKFSDMISQIDSSTDMSLKNKVKFVWDSVTNVSGDEILFTVRFQIKPNVKQGLYEIATIKSETMFTDENLSNIVYTELSGFVNVTNIKKGDVNGDNMINGKDVVLLRQYIADWPSAALTEDQLIAADVTNEEIVNGKDVVKLRQYLADWPNIDLNS
ncbi:MAG: InlB B-repeat-containing protein, partial [Firmicutes bacterium]|nr:InlB B-repeat-containing protein [Bacillota bacterium]